MTENSQKIPPTSHPWPTELPSKPDGAMIARACRTRYGIVELLWALVDAAVPWPWDREMPKATYGRYWSGLLAVLEDLRTEEVGWIETSHRDQTPVAYAADQAMGRLADELDRLADERASLPAEEVHYWAEQLRLAQQGLKNYRAEPITDQGNLCLVGHTNGPVWHSVPRWSSSRPYLEYTATVAEEMIEMAAFDPLKMVYEKVRRAVDHKIREGNVRTAGPPVIQIRIRQEILQ